MLRSTIENAVDFEIIPAANIDILKSSKPIPGGRFGNGYINS